MTTSSTDTTAATLTRLTARDELADACARLDVVAEELAGDPFAVVAGVNLGRARLELGRVVRMLSLSLKLSTPPSCACGHGADVHALSVDSALAPVVCQACPCSSWAPA